MKQIKESEKLTTIFLEDGDSLEICRMEKNNIKIHVKCINNSLHFDEITYKELKHFN